MNKNWPEEFGVLAQYRAKIARGIVHTVSWNQYMAEVQRHFDRWIDEDTRRRSRSNILWAIFGRVIR